MVICAGNSTEVCEKAFQMFPTVVNLLEVYNSNEKDVERFQINEPTAISEIFPYFHKIQSLVKDPIDYFCFRLHPDANKNDYRKEFIKAAKSYGIKNIQFIEEAKALLMNTLSVWTKAWNVFWVISCDFSQIDCYLWEYHKTHGWKFKSHYHQWSANFERERDGLFEIPMTNLLDLKSQIKETEITPNIFVLTPLEIAETAVRTFKTIFPSKKIVFDKPKRSSTNTSLSYARCLSGEAEYSKYKSEEILEKLIEIKVDDITVEMNIDFVQETVIQAKRFCALPLSESLIINSVKCDRLLIRIYENNIYQFLSIPFPTNGDFNITLNVDVNGIYEIKIMLIDLTTPYYSIPNILKPIISFDDVGVEETSGLLNFEVDETDSETFSSLYNENDVYRNFSSPKGLALIINNEIYDKEDKRNGTDIDELNTRHLLNKLEYEIKAIQRNLSGEEMLSAAKDFANDKSHKLYDSCVVFVFTHGKYDFLCGSDGNYVNVYDFLDCFNAKNAPALRGKPKLFFLQSCRGEKKDNGIDTTDFIFSCLKRNHSVEEVHPTSLPSLSSAQSSVSHNVANPVLLLDPPRQPTTFISETQHAANRALLLGTSRQPTETDMLIAYATTPNYASWRNPNNGSWFIQSIYEVFSKHAAKEDICSLLIRKNKETEFQLQFCNQISKAYRNRLQTTVNEIIATENRDYKLPLIFFTGIDEKYIYTKNLSSKIWVTDELRIRNYVNPEHSIITSVCSKFYQCDANNLHLCKQNILFSDLQFFASSCKSINLKMSTVINDIGNVVPLENIVEVFSNITYFCCDIAPVGRNAVTSKTVQKLLEIPHFQNLKYLDLLKIPEAFDIGSFYEYIKKNKKTDIYLIFCDQISEAYKARLQTIVDEILATENRNFKPPYISFSGHDEISSDELYNLYLYS